MIGEVILAVCASDGTYRLVFELAEGFVVYKAFRFNELWTVKYWHGTPLSTTAARWKTNQVFEPDQWMVDRARQRIREATLRLADLPIEG